MRRVPVAATIRDAYAFTAAHLGGIIGLIWVPMVIVTVAQFFTFHRYYNDFIDFAASGNAAQMGSSVLLMLGYIVAALLLYAVMFVAVTQLALGTRSNGAIVHFAFGPLEWRMFRALFAFTGLMVLAALVIVMAANAALAFGQGGSKLSQAAAAAIMGFGLLGLALVLAPRFLVLLPAVSVSEAAPVLRRTWFLSTGNFLRLVAVFLGLFAPLFVILVAVEFALGDKAQSVAAAGEQMQLIATVMHARQALPLTCGLSFLFSPLIVGLFAGASVSAWRALKDEPSVEIVA
jgi:hypothetical protein